MDLWCMIVELGFGISYLDFGQRIPKIKLELLRTAPPCKTGVFLFDM
jgi:hypothetical protein